MYIVIQQEDANDNALQIWPNYYQTLDVARKAVETHFAAEKGDDEYSSDHLEWEESDGVGVIEARGEIGSILFTYTIGKVMKLEA